MSERSFRGFDANCNGSGMRRFLGSRYCTARQSVALAFGDHPFRAIRWVGQLATDFLDRFAYGFAIKIEAMLEKHVRMNSSNTIGTQCSLWEVSQVECYDFRGTAMIGSRRYVAIAGIG
jgi:hypothetical protein